MFDRFMHKVDASWGPTGSCWEWRATKDRGGYGRFSLNGKLRMAHRVSYEMFVGPIPVGLQLDHLCRNRGCVRPDHLETVTNQENARRGNTGKHNSNKTHCNAGHEFTKDNTLSITRPSGGRECKKCKVIRSRRYNQERLHA